MALVVSVAVSIVATVAGILIATPHLFTILGPDMVSTTHAAWIHIWAPGMPFPARLSARALKIWAACFTARYAARLSTRFDTFSPAF